MHIHVCKQAGRIAVVAAPKQRQVMSRTGGDECQPPLQPKISRAFSKAAWTKSDGSVAKPRNASDKLAWMSRSRPPLFKWRHFEPAVITCAVGWYLRFSLSYRNVEELLTERGLGADHTTI